VQGNAADGRSAHCKIGLARRLWDSGEPPQGLPSSTHDAPSQAASRGTIANRRSRRILQTTAEMPRERLFILVVAVHREVVDTGLTLRIIHPLVSTVAEKGCK
jgi:hypothetical protein